MSSNKRAVVASQIKWDDLRVPAQNTRLNPAVVKPDFDVFIGQTRTFLFDPASTESVHFSVQIPHSYKLGTNLLPHVHWAPTDATTGTVTWKLEYTIANVDGTFPTTTVLSVSDVSDEVAFKHQFADLGDITGTAIDNVSTMLICRLFRDVGDGDDYASDAALLEIDFHFQLDDLGSSSETAK